MLLLFFTSLNFIVFMTRCFFLLGFFLVIENYELSKSMYVKYAIDSGTYQNSILIHLFFSTSINSLIIFCVTLLSELMMLLLTHHVTNDLTCRTNLRQPLSCNLSCKSKLFENIAIFHQLHFDLEKSRFGT